MEIINRLLCLFFSLAPLVSKVKEHQVEMMVDTLCSNMMSDKEQLRDISSMGLKTVIAELPPSSLGQISHCHFSLEKMFNFKFCYCPVLMHSIINMYVQYIVVYIMFLFFCTKLPLGCQLCCFVIFLLHLCGLPGLTLTTTVCKKITSQLIGAMKQEDVSVQLEALDILSDMLGR